MEKFNYYFNTQDRISMALDTQINKNNINFILFNLVWYAYYQVSEDEKSIAWYISDWMRRKNAPFHLAVYAKTIRSYINKMKDIPWRNFDGTIKIRQSELDYIASFNDIKKEKILFCYLAIAKFKDEFRDKPTHWENENDIVVFKMARVSIPSKDRDYYIHQLIYDYGARIYMNFNNNDHSKRIDYVSDNENDKIVLELNESNYYELAYTYLNWKNNGGYKVCRKCGRLFKIRNYLVPDTADKTSKAQICWACTKKYTPKYKDKDTKDEAYQPKIITCMDCGATVFVNNYKDSRTCRCEECQEKANQLSKLEWAKKFQF